MYKIHKNRDSVRLSHNHVSDRKKPPIQRPTAAWLATENRAQDKDRSDATERDVDVDIYAHVEP